MGCWLPQLSRLSMLVVLLARAYQTDCSCTGPRWQHILRVFQRVISKRSPTIRMVNYNLSKQSRPGALCTQVLSL